MPEKTRVEELQVNGEMLVAKIRELARETNVRRIAIRNAKGVTLIEIPLVVGLAGAAFVPVWAAVGALAALLAKLTLVIERVDDKPPKVEEPPAPPPPAPKPARKKNL